eukprot:974890_1
MQVNSLLRSSTVHVHVPSNSERANAGVQVLGETRVHTLNMDCNSCENGTDPTGASRTGSNNALPVQGIPDEEDETVSDEVPTKVQIYGFFFARPDHKEASNAIHEALKEKSSILKVEKLTTGHLTEVPIQDNVQTTKQHIFMFSVLATGELTKLQGLTSPCASKFSKALSQYFETAQTEKTTSLPNLRKLVRDGDEIGSAVRDGSKMLIIVVKPPLSEGYTGFLSDQFTHLLEAPIATYSEHMEMDMGHWYDRYLVLY